VSGFPKFGRILHHLVFETDAAGVISINELELGERLPAASRFNLPLLFGF
jgi:hypothetical protein